MRIFQVGWVLCSFPASFISSTYTNKNSPFSRFTNKHSQFGTFSQTYFNRTFGIQGGRLALGPFRLSKLGMTALLAPFLVGMCPSGRSESAKFRCGIHISLFGPPFWRLKTTKCEHSNKTNKPRSGSTKNACCLRHHIAKCSFFFFFRNFELPHFCTVFSTICGTVKKKILSQGARFQSFWDFLAHFEVQGARHFWFGMRHKIAGFYHELSVSVVPLVSVKSVMESNDVSMTRFCAVSSSGTHRSLMITVAVRAQPLQCYLREMWLVVYGYVIKSVMCVSLRCGKMC